MEKGKHPTVRVPLWSLSPRKKNRPQSKNGSRRICGAQQWVYPSNASTLKQLTGPKGCQGVWWGPCLEGSELYLQQKGGDQHNSGRWLFKIKVLQFPLQFYVWKMLIRPVPSFLAAGKLGSSRATDSGDHWEAALHCSMSPIHIISLFIVLASNVPRGLEVTGLASSHHSC